MAEVTYINKDKIIMAFILEPYENGGEIYDISPSHGWQVQCIIGFTMEGHSITKEIDCESEDECIIVLNHLGLTSVKTNK